MKPGGAIITLSVLAARNWWQVTWIRYRTLIAFLRATPQEWSGIRTHLLAKNRSFFGFIGSFLDRLGIFDNSLPQQMSRWRSSVYHLGTIPTAWSFVPRSLGFWNPIVVAADLRPTIRTLFSSKSTISPAHESKLEIQRFAMDFWHMRSFQACLATIMTEMMMEAPLWCVLTPPIRSPLNWSPTGCR